jgi:hypothetical protein
MPSANPIRTELANHSAYSLPRDRERSLADTLAFLSSRTDDPNHIHAVCLEEAAGSTNLNVLLAVNKINTGDGEQFLHQSKQGLERIFAVLSRPLDGKQHLHIHSVADKSKVEM